MVVAGQVPVPFDYVWDFGDGSALVTNRAATQDEAYELEARHIYHGSADTPFGSAAHAVRSR